MRLSKRFAVAIIVTFMSTASCGQAQETPNTPDVSKEKEDTPDIDHAAYTENCVGQLKGIIEEAEFVADKPTIMRYDLTFDGDPMDLVRQGVDGILPSVVKFGQGFEEGDIKDKRGSIDPETSAVLVWPERKAYVHASKELSDAPSAMAHLTSMCSLSKQGLIMRGIVRETILSRVTLSQEK